MVILYSIFSIIGLVVAIWYFSSLTNPYSVKYGTINFPLFLQKTKGHYISWFLIFIGVISFFLLYRSITYFIDFALFLKIVGGIFLFGLVVMKTILTPMAMPFIDVCGKVRSFYGLFFNGLKTEEFLEITKEMYSLNPLVRDRIIAEVHYSVCWLYSFPRLVFFISLVYSRSLIIASFCYIGAYFLEFFRLYAIGTSPIISHLSRIWSWIETPLFIGASILLWTDHKFISIILIILIINKFTRVLTLITTIMIVPFLPFKSAIEIWIIKLLYDIKHLPFEHQIVLLNPHAFIILSTINRWRNKLLPLEKSSMSGQPDKDEDITSFNNFQRAYYKRPWLLYFTGILYFGGITNIIYAVYLLISADYEMSVILFLIAVIQLFAWYKIHIWALRHPKEKG